MQAASTDAVRYPTIISARSHVQRYEERSVLGPGDLVSGKYRLVRLLGDGGMGSVYEATHEVLGTRVAIKVLHPELARRTSLVERFLQEARVSAKIRSPHIVQVIDVDRTAEGGHAYIVMELLEGESLAAALDRDRKLAAATACEYTLQILEGLEAAHALGVVHRDLKPENVFVTFLAGKPVLKIIDFGIAKLRTSEAGGAQRNLTVAGVVMGTAEYMAPEQARSADKVDARADIYAVGVMLYEMLSGTRPVLGDDARVIALRVERGDVTPLVQAAPDAPRELAGLVHRAMAARPELRFANATEMRMALSNAMSGKRPPTGVMPQAPVANPGTPAADVGTGTLKGAPAKEVLAGARGTRVEANVHAPPAVATSVPDEPRVDTVRTPALGGPAGAMGAMMGAPMLPAHVPPAPQDGRHRPKRSSSMIVWLIAVPLLLGAGLVAAYVATQTTEPAPQPTTTTKPTTPASTSAKPTASATTSGSGDPLAPFNPSATPTHPGVGPVPPHPSGLPSGVPATGDAGVPNIFPSTLPSGFPPIPSGFPTAWPTAFPSGLPFPIPAPPAPSPHAAPPSSGPGY